MDAVGVNVSGQCILFSPAQDAVGFRHQAAGCRIAVAGLELLTDPLESLELDSQ